MVMKSYSTIPRYSLLLCKEKNLRYPVEKIGDALQAEVAFRAYLEDKDCEHLTMIMLDGQNNMIGIATVAIGGLTGVQTGIRDIFKFAIMGRAHAFMLGHNHPSGDCTPSREDIVFTQKVMEAGKLMGIPLMDHIIVSSGINAGSYSFMQHGVVFIDPFIKRGKL
jgi:DNA repair protein RadC